MIYAERYKHQKQSFTRISRAFEDEIHLTEEFFDIQQQLFDNYFFAIVDKGQIHLSSSKVLCQAFIKNQSLIFSASILVRQSQYGTARVLFRQILEFLIFAKYVSVSNDELFARKWLLHEPIHMTNHVLNKIKHPSTHELRAIYKAFHGYTHAASGAVQIHFNRQKLVDELHHDLVWILILQVLNYHLLCSHVITDNMKYYADYWGDNGTESKQLRKKAKDVKRKIVSKLTAKGRATIREYVNTWEVKSEIGNTFEESLKKYPLTPEEINAAKKLSDFVFGTKKLPPES